MSKLVIALGGNALGKTSEEQKDLLKTTSSRLVDLIEKGHEIVITHGNGPQVGMIYNGLKKDNIPFAESGAMSQGYIGYQLQQALKNEFQKRNINKEVVTLVTQVEVNPKDAAFDNPTKPIGEFLSKKEADKRSKLDKLTYKEDSGRGYRRVIASPKPIKIIEIGLIEELLNKGFIVIACGGGGIPVVEKENTLEGIDAVIDKDYTSSLLARCINADKLLILTAVEKVSINFGKPNEKQIANLSVKEAKDAIRNNEFGEGSMLPKIKAAIKFVRKTGNDAIITSLDKTTDALEGKTGTVIHSVSKEKKE
ncbi:MAG: carbamate kinase [Mollicutes bacterium]|nr:carbamate kinase [Mollicutes bacterium]